jgi:hypothetical protein
MNAAAVRRDDGAADGQTKTYARCRALACATFELLENGSPPALLAKPGPLSSTHTSTSLAAAPPR